MSVVQNKDFQTQIKTQTYTWEKTHSAVSSTSTKCLFSDQSENTASKTEALEKNSTKPPRAV